MAKTAEVREDTAEEEKSLAATLDHKEGLCSHRGLQQERKGRGRKMTGKPHQQGEGGRRGRRMKGKPWPAKAPALVLKGVNKEEEEQEPG